MFHARIAARAFNTPLLVEPSKALAFVSGLGPRILGRRVEITDQAGVQQRVATPAARASILAGGLAEGVRPPGEAPYPVMDGIAVIEISGVLIHRGSWITLRSLPREIVTLRHRLDALGIARVVDLMRAGFAEEWWVPLWHMAQQPTMDLTQGDLEIALDTSVADFRAEGFAAVAVDGGEAGPVEINAIQPDRLILAEPLVLQAPTMTVSAGRVTVAPLRIGILASALEIERRRQNDGTVSATFLLRDAPDPVPAVLPSYLGFPVQTDPSLTRTPLSASLRRAVEYVDNGFGPVVIEPLRDVFERGETITLKAQGPLERWALRRWLWSLRGRQASFWLPTWGRELQLQAAMTSGSVQMRVAPVAQLAAYVGRKILQELPSGLRFRTITAAIAEGALHRLTISSNLGEPVPVGTKVHFMTHVRSDADRVEIEHGAVASEVTLPVVEVPE